MQLDEVKVLIREQGVTDELLKELMKSLRRVRESWNRVQNCFIIALEVAGQDYSGAVRLIVHAQENYAQTLFERYELNCRLAEIHQQHGEYEQVKASYLAAMDAVEADLALACHRVQLCGWLMRNELYLTDFAWSEDLERYYEGTEADDIYYDIRQNALNREIAAYTIAEHSGDQTTLADASIRMGALLHDMNQTEVERMLRRHRIDPSIQLDGQQRDFLQRIGIL